MNKPVSAGLLAIASAASLTPAAWNALAGKQPFLQHAFLASLEDSGCVGVDTGWIPHFLVHRNRNGSLDGALPLYVKHHSYGEYVFDWAWADAYHRHGLHYYPKLLSAVPFTPVTGPRLLAHSDAVRGALVLAAIESAKNHGLSSLHALFLTPHDAATFADNGFLLRHTVQFHWRNKGYATFDDFLREMSHDKRKKIRQERRKLAEGGIQFYRLTGAEIADADWIFFYECYSDTYRRHRSTPYLNLAFFRAVARSIGDRVMLVVARRHGKRVAAALNFFDEAAFYGRYWGAMEYIPGLHFETCYYQGIEFCIEHKIPLFEGGAQGEHKLARGFEPVLAASAHWLAHPEFNQAVERYLDLETEHTERYLQELEAHAPFKR